jgi:spore coat protein U-like protein
MTKVKRLAKHEFKRVMGRFTMLIACASALVLSSVSPARAALTCNAGNVTLNYGTYDVLAGTVLDAAGTITVTCTRSGGPQIVDYTIALTPLSPRQLSSGFGSLDHQLYLDSARTAQPWGDGTGGTFVINGSFSVPNNSTASDVPKNFYARITPGGQDVSAASYMQTFTVTVTCNPTC